MESERACEPGALAGVQQQLVELADCRLQLERAGPEDGSAAVTTWVLRWWDGPTTTQMRSQIADFEPLHRARGMIPLCYEHRLTSWGRALAVLLWLNSQPSRAQSHEAVIAQLAAEQIGYPDCCAPGWQHRAAALLNLSPQGRRFTLSALGLLLQCARNESWAAAMDWLDSLGPHSRACVRIVR